MTALALALFAALSPLRPAPGDFRAAELATEARSVNWWGATVAERLRWLR